MAELEAEEAFLKMLTQCHKQGKALHPPLNLFVKFEQAYMDARKAQLQQGPTFSVNMYVSKDMLCKWVTPKKNRLTCYPTHGFTCTAGNTVNAYARWKTTHLLNRQSFGASQTLDALLHDDGLEKYSVIKINEWGRRHCRLIALDLENGLLKNFGLLQGKNHLRSSQDLSFDKYTLGELDKKKEMRIDHVLQCERSTVDPNLLTIVFIEAAHHAHWQLIFNSQELRETFCDSLLHSSDTEKQRGLEEVDAFRAPGRSSAASSHWDILRQSRGGSSHMDHGMSSKSLLGGKGSLNQSLSQRSMGNMPGSPSYSAVLSSNSVRGLNLPAGVSHLPGSSRAPSPSHEFSNSDLTGVVNPLFESKSHYEGGGHVGGHVGGHEGQLSDKIDGMVRSFNARLKSIDETHRSDKKTLREMISKQHTIHHEIVTTIAKSISSLKADIFSIKARDNDARVASGTSGAGRVLVGGAGGGGGDVDELECLRQNVRDLKKRNLELESKVRESSWRLWW